MVRLVAKIDSEDQKQDSENKIGHRLDGGRAWIRTMDHKGISFAL